MIIVKIVTQDKGQIDLVKKMQKKNLLKFIVNATKLKKIMMIVDVIITALICVVTKAIIIKEIKNLIENILIGAIVTKPNYIY